MTDWNGILSRIETQHPFLSSLQFSAAEDAYSDILPDLLKLSVVSTANLVSAPNKRVSMVFPCLYDTAAWIAVGTALIFMRSKFEQALTTLPPLHPDTKVKVDGVHIAILESETEAGYRLRLHSGTIRKHGSLHTWITIPKGQRLRLQETETARPPSQFTGIPRPQKEFLDHLLCIETHGNRSLFPTCVILVTGVGQCSALFQSTGALSTHAMLTSHPPITFSKLLQWGSLRMDGSLENRSTGQLRADPVLLLAPDLLAVRAFLRENTTVHPLIILNGGSSVARREGVLDDILDAGCPTLACLETHEADRIAALSNCAFDLWAWSRRDYDDLIATESRRHPQQVSGIFTDLRRAYCNFARKNVVTQVCQDEVFQAIAENVHAAVRALRGAESGESHIEVEHALYGCLLPPSRSLRPFLQDDDGVSSQIARLQRKVVERHLWIPSEASDIAIRVMRGLLDLHNGAYSHANAKQRAIEALLLEAGQQSVCIMVRNSFEVQVTDHYWRPFLDKHRLNVRFIAFDAANTLAPCDHLIVCGWLNQKRMRRLMEGTMAVRTTVLLYPFEDVWSRRAVRCWNTTSVQSMSDHAKSALLTSGEAVVIQSVPERSPDSGPDEDRVEPDAADLAEFETRLHQHQWGVLLRSGQESHEETLRATCVRFSSGYYAFLTDSYRVSVVTDLLMGVADREQKVPQKTCKELREGDYVVFREGAQSDVLRELADRGLTKAGRGGLRAKASLWKVALRNFVGIAGDRCIVVLNRERFSTLVRRLRQEGIQTGEGTIRWWLLGDNTIGPRPVEYLAGIANATGDGELQARMAEVREAIEQVRGAHLQAARHLAVRLLAALPSRLALASIETSPRVDLGEDGSVIVVRVEEIAEKPVDAGFSRVNYLLDEAALDSALSAGVF